VATLPTRTASGILATEDIAYAGKRHEYDAAGLWLDELAFLVGCTAADIQMVPGNYDVDRDQIKGLTEMMLAAIGSEADQQSVKVDGHSPQHFSIICQTIQRLSVGRRQSGTLQISATLRAGQRGRSDNSATMLLSLFYPVRY